MELILMIIIFVVFNVINDAIEKKKKQRPHLEMPPQERTKIRTKMEAETKERKRTIDILLPPNRAKPQQGSPLDYQQAQQTPAFKPQYAEAPASKPAIVEMIPAIVEQNVLLKQADIHSNVLLHAVAYSQILQPPKAYQYLATRSCRGDWNNNK